jgi:hypothetical protein
MAEGASFKPADRQKFKGWLKKMAAGADTSSILSVY